ncbi:uncharacterized protein RSE6_01522 [Rhynchosporium secalis]|uniref:Uncharacterized protein n=1 Tax=Rhynchosporium secalis TaxID=38038 RepID=A0A1E1LY04_RHYSE|nr:uncharacterized protein RSE6_01522 [Rhynchosporium secalis]
MWVSDVFPANSSTFKSASVLHRASLTSSIVTVERNYTYIGTESSVLCECWSCVFTLRCKANGRLRSLPFGALARGPGIVVFGFCGSGTATHAAPAMSYIPLKSSGSDLVFREMERPSVIIRWTITELTLV